MSLVTCLPQRVSSTHSRTRDHFVCLLLFPQCPEQCPACSQCLPWGPGTARKPHPRHHHWHPLPRSSPAPLCPAGFSASKPAHPVPHPDTQLKYVNSLVAEREERAAWGPVLFTAEAWQGRPSPGARWWQGGEIVCTPTPGGGWLAGGTFACKLGMRGNEQGGQLSNGRSGICLQQIFSDFPKHLKLIRWTRDSGSPSRLESHPCQG